MAILKTENTENESENKQESDSWLFDDNQGVSKRDIPGFNYNILGTENNLHYITTCEELQKVADDLEANYQLIQNIDCSDTKNWNNGMGFIPIGGSNFKSFEGTFNGNKYNISGLYIEKPTIDNVGLFGEIYSRSSKISNVGLIDVDITGRDAVGGLVGKNNDGIILNTFAIGKIHANNRNVGGLVGTNRGIISKSYTTGKISGMNDVGGLAGENHKTIANCYSMATINGIDGKFNGGLVGTNWGTIYDSFSSGRVLSEGFGLVGLSVSGEVFNSYWDIEASQKPKSRGGTGKSPTEMKQRSTYQGWNFFEVWQIKEGDSHPTFRKTPFVINFSHIPSPQVLKTPIRITLTASDDGFNGRIFLDCARGKISPLYIHMVNSVWTGKVLLYSLGKDNSLGLRWYSKEEEDSFSGSSVSNVFDVVDQNNQIPNNAILIGKVTDDFQNPIADATVNLYSGDPKYNDVQTYTRTDSSGNYKFQNLLPEEFFLRIEKPGYQVSFQTVDTTSNRTITGNAVLHRSCKVSREKKDLKGKGLVPVLLVPGFMGSKSRGDIYPSLPIRTPKWDDGVLKIHDIVYPFESVFGSYAGWSDIKTKLKEHGYVEGCTLFEVPYDWTLSVEEVRDQFLIPWIKRAKRNNTKVDIIAHSMGGLVARSYIQSHQYAGDVRKLAMVGTPNKGAIMAYYVWEGGNTIVADKFHDSFVSTIVNSYFYTNTLFYLYKERFSRRICSFWFWWSWYPWECDEIETYNLVHESVHSLSQLMPIYNRALLDYETNKYVSIEKEENTFLKALNNLDCLNPEGCVSLSGKIYLFKPPRTVFSPNSSESKVETKLFAGINKKTIETITVKRHSPSYNGILYKDGTLLSFPVYSTFGDGLVLADSVIFNDFFHEQRRLSVEKEDAKHAKLIGKFCNSITSFITNEQNLYLNVEKRAVTVKEPVLVIAIDGRVQSTITGPTNIKIKGKDLELNYSSLEINGLIDGEYTVTLRSSYNEDYDITLTYVDTERRFFFEKRAKGYYNNTLTTFTFTLNRKSTNNTIEFDRSFSTPVDLQMRNGANNQIHLTWQDPTGALRQDVEYYSIFWKRNFNPYFQFLAHVVNEKSYQTNHSWLNALENTYVVKAKLNDTDRSTFFSPPTWINSKTLSVSSSATSLDNPFSMITSTVRSCINKVFALFTPTDITKNMILQETDSTDLTQINVAPIYEISTNNKDIPSLTARTRDFIPFGDEGKHPFTDHMPMISQTLFENLHANIMLGHVAVHWINSIFQRSPKKFSNSKTERVNKRKVTSLESIHNVRLQLAMLKENLLETEKKVDYLIKVFGKKSVNWIVWGLEDFLNDIQTLEDKPKNDEVNLEEVSELKQDVNFFIIKVDKKYNEAVQTPSCYCNDAQQNIGSVFKQQIPASENVLTEKYFLQGRANLGLQPNFPRDLTTFKQNTNGLIDYCERRFV